jgi:hypothetical protein
MARSKRTTAPGSVPSIIGVTTIRPAAWRKGLDAMRHLMPTWRALEYHQRDRDDAMANAQAGAFVVERICVACSIGSHVTLSAAGLLPGQSRGPRSRD